MNILQVINSKWWNAETDYAFSLTKGLRDKGHAVSIVALSGKPVVKKALEEGINCFQTTALNSYNPFLAVKAIKRLIGIINEEKIEVINCHRSEGFPLVLLASLLASKKLAIVRTRGDQRQVRKGLLNRMLYEKYTQAIITSGKIVKKDLISRLGLKEEKIKVIYSSVDKDRFRFSDEYKNVRPEFGITNEETLIAILGRDSEIKGHKYFIEAASIVLKSFSDARFLIIVNQTGDYLKNIKEQIKEARLGEKLLITGYREDLVDVMLSSDIGVVSSLGSETNCRVVLEWMSVGKPVVGTTVGVIPEVIIDRKTGCLVPPGDSAALADAIMKLVDDKNKCADYGLAGRAIVEKEYTIEKMVENTLDLYQEALS